MSAFDGHFGRVGPRDVYVHGYHEIERDLESQMEWGLEPESVDALTYTRWLWAAIFYALQWDVPKH